MVNPQVLFENAVAALNSGDLAKAEKLAGRLTKQLRNEPEVWLLRATIAGAAGAFGHAQKYYRRVLQLRPDDTVALNNLGGTLRQLGKPEPAIEAYRKSLTLNPAQPDVYFNVGKAYAELERFDEAIVAFRSGTDLQPNDQEMMESLAYAAYRSGALNVAIENYRRLLDLGRETGAVLVGLYSLLAQQGDMDAAEAVLDRLLEVAGDDPQRHVDGSILYLIQGKWERGWRAYAKRWQTHPEEARPLPQPWWQGEPLDGRTVTVWGEQGLGDEIMYASMIPDLVATGARVTFEMDVRNVALFQRSFPNVQCVGRTDPPDPAVLESEFQIPVGDLGIWLRRDESDFPGGAPFLAPDQEQVRALREKYLQLDGGESRDLLVGVTWRSFGTANGHLKSIALETLTPVIQTPGAVFVDLQYGDVTAERQAFETASGLSIYKDVDIDPMGDIDAHAAQVAAMDVIISTSNTTVHLGGAMGVPTWILIQEIADRRWLLGREDSPWYNSVRLFRRETEGEWDGVVSRVAAELADLVARSS